MKKFFTACLLITPLLAFRCSDEAAAEPCGCEGATTEEFKDVEAIVENPENGILMFFPVERPNFAVVPCGDLDAILPEFKIDKMKVKISGQVKAACSDTPSRFAGLDFVITNIERAENGQP